MAEEKPAQPKKKDHIIVIAIVIGSVFTFFLSLFVISCYTKDTPAAWARWDGESPMPEAQMLAVLGGGTNDGCLATSCYGTVTGSIINNTNTQLEYIEVTVGVYAGSTRLTTCTDSTANLPPQRHWGFSASCVGIPTRDWSYKIENVVFY